NPRKKCPLTRSVIDATKELMERIKYESNPLGIDQESLANKVAIQTGKELDISWGSKFLSAISNLFYHSYRVSSAHLLLQAPFLLISRFLDDRSFAHLQCAHPLFYVTNFQHEAYRKSLSL